MTIVPFRKAERARKRRTLDQAQVARAALELLDEVGLDELTMRRLGALDIAKAALCLDDRCSLFERFLVSRR